jgi:hypothetical protein
MTEQLKPCPFCGGDNITIEETKSEDIYRVDHYCNHLDVLIRFKELGYEEAINKWNSRAISVDETDQSDIRHRHEIIADLVNANKRIKELEREVQHWKSNHSCEVERARVLKERTDMPLERVQAYEQISEMQDQLRKLKGFANRVIDESYKWNSVTDVLILSEAERLGFIKVDNLREKADWLKD